MSIASSSPPPRYYESPAGASFPNFQILTVEDLLEGTERPSYPDLMQGGLIFRKAKREVAAVQLDLGAVVDLVAVQTQEEVKVDARRKGARVARGETTQGSAGKLPASAVRFRLWPPLISTT